MTEDMPPTLEEMRQLNRDLMRDLMKKILDKACSDPTWKQQLIDDPEAAMRTANFPELKRLEELHQSAWGSREEGAEVRGQQVVDHYDLSGGGLWRPICVRLDCPFYTYATYYY